MKLLITLCLSLTLYSFASIPVESEGMDASTRGDGTFLMASPTYTYDRPSMQGGIHSSSEEWAPEKLRMRLLVNRYSVTPSWDIQSPAVWLATGNEIGDMLYNDVLVDKKDWVDNATPMMNFGFRSRPLNGFWATARGFQVDHYSTRSMRTRTSWVGGMEYSFFGENLPFFSSVYAGLGYTGKSYEASILAGKEYLWVLGESGRWIPSFAEPRVEARYDYRNFQATLEYQDLSYENQGENESGSRKEWSGSVRLACNAGCEKSDIQFGGGVAFRVVDDQEDTYFGLEDDYVVWPFVELVLRPTAHLEFAGHGGINNRDWLVKDSLEMKFFEFKTIHSVVGFKNHLGSTLNPLGESYEYFGDDTLHLTTDGFMQLHRVFLDVREENPVWDLGMNIAYWVEAGAETFDPTSFTKKGVLTYRTGDVDRIDSWIRGLSGEASANFRYDKLFSLGARAGFERIDGEEDRFEINPVEEWVQINAHWLINKTFQIDHSWIYRTDANWNLRSEDPLVIKGDWYWNASFSQLFPKYGLSLTGTILHVLSDDQVLVPNGGYDRTRFFCNIRKTF